MSDAVEVQESRMRVTFGRSPSPAPPVGTPVTWGQGGRRVGTVTHVYEDGQVGFDIDDPEALRALGVPEVFRPGQVHQVRVPQLSVSATAAVVVPPRCGWRGWAGSEGCVLEAGHEGKHRFERSGPVYTPARCASCMSQGGKRHAPCGRKGCSCRHR